MVCPICKSDFEDMIQNPVVCSQCEREVCYYDIAEPKNLEVCVECARDVAVRLLASINRLRPRKSQQQSDAETAPVQ